MKKPCCRCCLKSILKNDNTDFITAQYNVISNEFVNALHGAQTVITINLAVTIGVLAILATLFSEIYLKDDASCLLYIACSVCSFIGLFGTISCIRTIHISRESIMKLEKRLESIENKYCSSEKRQISYYKPLHITLEAFWVFAFIFDIILSISLLQVLNNCFKSVKISTNLGSCTITVLIVSCITLFSVIISNQIYKAVNKKLLKQLYEKGE